MPPRMIDGVDQLRSLVGQEIGQSEWVDVTQEMIDAFADVTRDHQWIHQDRARAERESPFKTTIAHGFLTLSLMSHLHQQSVEVGGERKMAINYGLNRVRFPSPVPSGARIRSRSKLESFRDIPGGVQFTYLVTIDVENSDKPALVAEWIGRWYL